jgi:hypothetical protein
VCNHEYYHIDYRDAGLTKVLFFKIDTRSEKFKVFCDVAPCSHVELTDVSEVRTASVIRAMRPDDEGSTNLRNVGQLQRDYQALHHRRLHTRLRENLKSHILDLTTL